MNSPTELETRLRASLADHARQAPPGAPVADRILAELDGPPAVPRNGWRGWMFPLLAAAAIAVVALAVVGLSNVRFSHPGERAGTQPPSTAPSSAPALRSTAPTLPPLARPARTVVVARMPDFHVSDASFYGAQTIWALGSVPCPGSTACPISGSTLVRSSDGGRSWRALTTSVPGIGGVRFANPQTGYAFGPSAFYVTTDGGAHWTRSAGGADAVETLDQTVIRVSRMVAGCHTGCRFTVSHAGISASGWQPATIATLTGDSVQLERVQGAAYLLVRSGVGGMLFRSTDGGSTWMRVPSCGRVRQVALNLDGVNLLCGDQILVRANTSRASFVPVPTSVSDVQLSAVGHTLFVAGDRLYRSTDSGTSWHAVLNAASANDVGPPGFQSDSVGRWFTDGGASMWTTRDGGQTWTGVAFAR